MTLQDIRQAIRDLSRDEREELSVWLSDSWEGESQVGAVQEARVAYGDVSLRHMTVAEYLVFEEQSPWRHEYLNGSVFTMSGVSVAHNQITFRLAKALSDRLRGEPCEVFLTDLKLRMELGEDEIFYYPDVMVACNPSEWGKDFIRNPRVVAEVLSPSTRHIDQREKSLNYHRTASIEEYLILSQTDHHAFLHRREDGWAPHVLSGPDALLELHSLGISMRLEEIYDEGLVGRAFAPTPEKQ